MAANSTLVANWTINETAESDLWLSKNMEYVYIESVLERNIFVSEMAIFFFVGIVGNSILISVFVDRLRDTQRAIPVNKYNYLTACLSVADLLVCGVDIPVTVLNRLKITTSEVTCQAFQFLSTALTFLTIFLLVGVAVERFYAVAKPTSPFSKRHACVICGVAAIASLLINASSIPLSSVYLLYTDKVIGCHIQTERPLGFYYTLALAIIVSGVSLTCIVLYALLYRIICQQLSARHRKSLHPQLASSSHTDTKVHAVSDDEVGRRSVSRQHQDKVDAEGNARAAKVTFMLFGVTIVFFVSWIPYILTAFQLIPYNVCLIYLFYANNCSRCITYGVMNKKLRGEMAAKLKVPCKTTSSPPSTSL